MTNGALIEEINSAYRRLNSATEELATTTSRAAAPDRSSAWDPGE
jgi:hypothetical protein